MGKAIMVLLVFGNIFCYGQSKFGVQIDLGRNYLTGISKEQIVTYGYSGAESSQSANFYISPSLRYRKKIADKFSLEAGIGYIGMKNDIRLEIFHPLFRFDIDTSLNIRLGYLSIPIGLIYSTPVTSNSAFVFIISMNSDILLSQRDNFESIIFEEIGWVKREWYTRLIFSPLVSLGYEFNIKKVGTVEGAFYASKDINPFVNDRGWGFYENLQNTRGLRVGLTLKYFINI